jgi:flagellar M-ring protein FliF
MADNPVLDRLSGFASQPVARQLSLLAGFAASVALAIGVVNWASTPSYEPVYGAMSPADNATAINVLQASGIQYRMEQGTGLLEVPYDSVLQARMALASEGFPRNGGGVGFESLYEEQEMGLSSFMEQARYHRAVEDELARTIAAMDSVSAARVHLAIAKQSAFMRRGNEPSASVMVNLLPGVRLNERQLAGIIHLVASSIPNLDSARVSVVDQAGKLLSSQGEDTDFGYTSEQFRLAQQLENTLNDRITAILEPILGVGAVRAQVAADMDFRRIESTSESYDPSTVIRSEQTSEDISNRQTPEGGVPGQLVAQPPQVGVAAQPQNPQDQQVAQNTSGRQSRQETRNYEVNKSISHVREVPGVINRLSVAVVVDYTVDDQGNPVALEPALLDQINALVREAVGFNQARGDTVQVINSPFVAPDPIEPLPEPGFLEQPWVWELGRGTMAALAVLALIFAVLRPMIRYSTTYTPPVAPEQPRLAGAVAGDDEALALAGPGAIPTPEPKPNYHQSIAMARNTAVEQPVRAAYVVKNWIAADG